VGECNLWSVRLALRVALLVKRVFATAAGELPEVTVGGSDLRARAANQSRVPCPAAAGPQRGRTRWPVESHLGTSAGHLVWGMVFVMREIVPLRFKQTELGYCHLHLAALF